VGQHVAAIIFDAEAADPTIENLDNIGASADLRGGVFGGDVDQLAHQLIPINGRVVHHLLRVQVVARGAAFDHVAGKGKGSSAETDHGNFPGEMLRDDAYSLGDVAEFSGAVGAELGNVCGGADWLLDDWAFSRGKMKRQAHDFEREQKVGENDRGIDTEKFSGGDSDFGGERRIFANFEQRVLLANGAIFGHVAAGLAHEPHWSAINGLGLAGTDEDGIWGRHDSSIRIEAGIQAGVKVRTDYFSIFTRECAPEARGCARLGTEQNIEAVDAMKNGIESSRWVISSLVVFAAWMVWLVSVILPSHSGKLFGGFFLVIGILNMLFYKSTGRNFFAKTQSSWPFVANFWARSGEKGIQFLFLGIAIIFSVAGLVLAIVAPA
jgi:hypothetical protein